MKYVGYTFIGYLVFWTVESLSIYISHSNGAGPGDIGIVSSAISILCSIVVICTLIIVDAIKNINRDK